jgi:predicted amidohydrolase YtcJ
VTGAAVVALALLAGGGPEPVTVVVGATVLDAGKAPLADAIVVISGGRIAAVGDRAHTAIPKGAALVDGRKLFVAPAPATPGGDLAAEIAGLLRGAEPRLRAGQPAHLALLSGDPRKGQVEIRRRWVEGRPVP